MPRLVRDNVYGKKRTRPDPFERRPFARQARLDQRAGEHTLSVYNRAGEPCFDCETPIERKLQGEQHRSTYYCPTCQPSRASP